MGVIYKLKQEVIDYILELKRVDQSLSCRKISELASTHFQRPISKSSVNAVLKDSSLSSPKGRRARPETRAEKFKIPEHRKEQIFINIPMSLLDEPKPVRAIAAVAVPTKIEHLGFLFLRAAEWQMKKQGILRFFCEKFGPIICDEKFLKLCEAFLFMPLLNERNGEHFFEYDRKSFWQLSGVYFVPSVYQKKECYDILLGLENKSQQIVSEYGQIFSEASFFYFTLEDGSDFCIDAQSNSFWEKDNVHCDFSSCLDKSFDFLSKDFITNSNPIILRQATVKESFPVGFFNMIASLENIPGKRIKRVDVMTSQHDAISSFEKIVNKRRFYITGLYGCRGLLDQFFSDKKKEPKLIEDVATGQSCYYWEATTAFRLADGQQLAADIALVSQKKDQAPLFAILTNIPTKMSSMDKVIRHYFERWPFPLRGHDAFVERQQKNLDACSNIVTFPDVNKALGGREELFADNHFLAKLSNNILLSLHDHCARHFFHPQDRNISLTQAQEKFYNLCGEMKKEGPLLKVKCVLPPAYVFHKELDFLLQRVNESSIFTPNGLRLFMEV